MLILWEDFFDKSDPQTEVLYRVKWQASLGPGRGGIFTEAIQEFPMPRKQSKQVRADAAKKGAAQASKERAAGPEAVAAVSLEERQRMIAEAAYFRAERRGFAAGGELDDWIEAETEIDRLVASGGSRSKHSLRVV